MAKFFPRWDDPYRITDVHHETSTYSLDIPTNAYLVYHVSKLKTHLANDPTLFPNQELPQPGPIITLNSLEEYLINQTINIQHCDHSWQFLVHWCGYGPEHDSWLVAGKLNNCEALNFWYQTGRDGLDTR